MQQGPNPYAPPADTDIPDGAAVIEEMSVWLMLLLSVVTVGMYLPHWLYTRGIIVNRMMDRPIVSISAIKALYFLYGVSLLMLVYSLGAMLLAPEDVVMIDASGFESVSNALDKIANIATLFAVFHFRNALHKLQRSEKGAATWLGGVATFFFGIFYFQYKINRGLLTTA